MATRRRTKRLPVLLATVAIAALGASCGGTSEAAGTAGTSALPFGSAADPRDATTTIEVETLDSMSFSPEEVTVERGEFGEAGHFLYGCHVPGHYEAGMVGTITVR